MLLLLSLPMLLLLLLLLSLSMVSLLPAPWLAACAGAEGGPSPLCHPWGGEEEAQETREPPFQFGGPMAASPASSS
jgi:hypothetical protein